MGTFIRNRSSCLFNTLVPHLRKLFWFLAIVLIILPLFVIDNIIWLLAIGVGIIGMIIGYDIWWRLIAGIATDALMKNESLFQSVWTAQQVALKTSRTIDGFYVYGGHKGSNC